MPINPIGRTINSTIGITGIFDNIPIHAYCLKWYISKNIVAIVAIIDDDRMPMTYRR